MVSPEDCNSVVVAFTQPNPGLVHAIGLMTGYFDCPTAILEKKDGQHSVWAAHLCRPATHQESEAFWRERALKAEAEMAAVVVAAGMTAAGAMV